MRLLHPAPGSQNYLDEDINNYRDTDGESKHILVIYSTYILVPCSGLLSVHYSCAQNLMVRANDESYLLDIIVGF